jgi:hypothetical protein
MLRRLFFPLKTNIVIMLLSFFALSPFCFLEIAKGAAKGGFEKEYSEASYNCAFDEEGTYLNSYNDIETKLDESVNSIKKLSKKDYLKTDYIVSGSLLAKSNSGRDFMCGFYYSPSLDAFKQYAGIGEYINAILAPKNDYFASMSKAFAYSNGFDAGLPITLSNYNDSTKTAEIAFDYFYETKANQSTSDIIVCGDRLDENIFNTLIGARIFYVHYYSSKVNSSMVQEASTKTYTKIECKDYKVEAKYMPYRVLFDQGRIVVAAVSVTTFLILFCAFLRKEDKLQQIEKIERCYYESKTKNFFIHLLSDVLLLIISQTLVLLAFVAAYGISYINGITLNISISFLYLFVVQAVTVLIESAISYFVGTKRPING